MPKKSKAKKDNAEELVANMGRCKGCQGDISEKKRKTQYSKIPKPHPDCLVCGGLGGGPLED